MNIRQALAAAAMMVGLMTSIATANAADAESDFLECVADHDDGIGVCCVFYGGTYDERTGECWDYPGATVAEQPARQPQTPPKKPALTRLPTLPVASVI